MESERLLDGQWLNSAGECVATVEDNVICWVDGPCSILKWCSSSEISVKVDGAGEYRARLDFNGELTWSDGDTWVRQCGRQTLGNVASGSSSGRQQRRMTRWQACGGSGGAGLGDAGREPTLQKPPNDIARVTVCGTSLLPDRAREVVCRSYGKSLFGSIASSPYDGCRYSANVGENTAVRVLLGATSPSFLVFELNSLSTYNMMDANLSWDLDWACDAALLHMNRTRQKSYTPIGCMNQGSGPHYCPGGNPQPVLPEGYSPFDLSQYCGYHPFVRIREIGVPIVAASHGAQVGGGSAYALNATSRICAHNTTISFGNVSRGAVPGMMLSSNIMTTLSFSGGMNLYLSDNTLSALGASKGGFIGAGCIGNSPQGSKTLGLRVLKQLATNANAARLLPMQRCVDEQIFGDEGIGIAMAGKSGTIFQSVDAKARAKFQASQAESLAELEGTKKSVVVQIPRPKGMPSRLPGQHLRGLRPGEQEVCVKCGSAAHSGVWGLERSDFEGMFFCTLCFAAMGDASSGKKKGRPKRRAKPQPPPLQTLPERAAAVHGSTVEGGILSWASYSTKCCWACMEHEAKFAGNHGGKQRYCSPVCKQRHEPVAATLSSYTWAPAQISIEMEQLVEACSFALWRERCFGTGVVEILEPMAFDSLPECDARRALQSEPKLSLKDAALPLLVVQQGEPCPEAMLYDDPQQRLPRQEDLWWQFVGTESSRTASALLVSSMLACLAADRVALMLDGKEVTNFGICKGEYVGSVQPLAIEDRSRGNVFAVPRRVPGTGKLCKHDWVFVKTQDGEHCIDLAAAQFGSKSRGKNGCPSVFLPKTDFEQSYREESRDEDPVEGYRDVFQDMLEEKEVEMNRVDKPWYKRVNHLEVFVCISGKVCSLLGLV